MSRHHALLLALVVYGATSPPTASGQKLKEQYDEFTDVTTVTLGLISDYPMLGPHKELRVAFGFKGKAQTDAPPHVLFIVAFGNAAANPVSDASLRLLERPPLYVLVDDSLRFQFEAVQADAGNEALSYVVKAGYAVPLEAFLQIANGTNLAFKVASWERRFKDKELSKLREFASRATTTRSSEP